MWFASAKPPYGTLDAAERAPSTASKADVRTPVLWVTYKLLASCVASLIKEATMLKKMVLAVGLTA
ncbi:MAG: hypothetical protein WB037_19745, partial [Pseudolabrys sp.]